MGTREDEAHRVQVIVGADLDNLYYGDEPEEPSLPCKRVPYGDIYEASRAGDVERLKSLLKKGVNVNVRDSWDSVALYYACLAGHLDAARMLMEHGAICSENTFDGDRCHYASLNLKVRKLLKAFEARPPPLDPLPKSLREVFLSSKSNFAFSKGISGSENSSILSDFPNSDHGPVTSVSENGSVSSGFSSSMLIDQQNTTPLSNASFVMGGTAEFKPDITFYVEGQPIEAHRAILSARSPYFKAKFQKDWKHKKEVRLSNNKLTFPALFSLVQFFYTDRLDVAVEDMEALSRICKVCGCVGLHKAVEKELAHQKFAEYKHMRNADDSQKRFILQGSSLPEHERLPNAMQNLLKLSLSKSKHEFHARDNRANLDKLKHSAAVTSETSRISEEGIEASIDVGSGCETSFEEDHADVRFSVEESIYRSHQVILAARSDYFRARFSRMECFGEENVDATKITSSTALPLLREEDLSSETFEKLLEYMYTDEVLNLHPNQAEELFDAASRYLLFPLKRVVADALLPHLETATPDELCQWLLLAEMYGVWKLREYCLDTIAANFELFSGTREFRKMLLSLPPPSGDSSQRTTAPSAPGEEGISKQANVLDDLREKWLEAEGAELDERDQSAMQFDKMLELLIKTGESEAYENENESGLTSSTGQEDVKDLNFESLSM